tara:strand:- start:543 stop:728 length:186 start_codon:yes stop_codon:yes gene_type:complete
MERTDEHAYKGSLMGKLFKFTFRITTDVAMAVAIRVLSKIERVFAQEPQRKQRYYDPVHDE